MLSLCRCIAVFLLMLSSAVLSVAFADTGHEPVVEVAPEGTVKTQTDDNFDNLPDTGPITAELDCGDSFEISPGDSLGKNCGIVVRNWRGNTDDRVEVRFEYDKSSGITITPGDWSVPPSLMYTAGVSDYYDRYVFSQTFRAEADAPPGITPVRIIIRQQNGDSVTLNLRVAVLEERLLPSSGPGIRPPAYVSTGSGGGYCVWRYKLFGDPPSCFHFVSAVCDHPVYTNPANGYELVGQNMSRAEGSAQIRMLSSYFQDQYGCFKKNSTSNSADSEDGEEDEDGEQQPPAPDEPDKDELPPEEEPDKPPAPVLTRFGVFCTPEEIKVGETARCKAIGEYSDNPEEYIDLTDRTSWTNGPEFIGKKKGSFQVEVALEGATDSTTIKVVSADEDGDGEYDPTADPGMGIIPPDDMEDVEDAITEFQRERTGGGEKEPDSGNLGGGEVTSNQPAEYNEPTIGGEPNQPPEQPESLADGKPDSEQPTDEQGGGDGAQPADKAGIKVSEVGTASPGKCKIVDGQLVPVKGYTERISGMTVILTGPITRSAVSTTTGKFTFPEIPAGDYTISVKGWDYGMTSAQFKAPSGKAVKVVLQGSCPYLYVWTKDGYVKENDLYSTARVNAPELLSAIGAVNNGWAGLGIYQLPLDMLPESIWQDKAYHDFYLLQHTPLRVGSDTIRLQIAEREAEYSFTDLVRLWAVEKPQGIKIGVTRDGETISCLRLHEVKNMYDAGGRVYAERDPIELYDREMVQVILPPEAFRDGVLVITWQGFQDGSSENHSGSPEKPRLALQRLNPQGEWEMTDWVYPRDEVEDVYLRLSDKGEGWDRSGKIRLQATSCLPFKYHRIDRIRWSHVAEQRMQKKAVPLTSARLAGRDEQVSFLFEPDGKALRLAPLQNVVLDFAADGLGSLNRYVFVLETKGVYVPAPQIRVMAHEESGLIR